MPDPTQDPSRKPDAILFPNGWEPPGRWTGANRVERLCRYFEGLMGASAAQKAHIRSVGGVQNMATLSPFDTLLYPEGHRYAKFPRYDWTTQPGGIQFGYLKQDDSQ